MNSCVRKSFHGCAPVRPSAMPWPLTWAKSARRNSRWAAVASWKVSPRPLRISISDLMSSPLIDSASGPVAVRDLGFEGPAADRRGDRARGGVAQLLEARDHVERLGVEERELLLEA